MGQSMMSQPTFTQHPGQCGERDRLDVPSEAQYQGQQEERAQRARHRRRSSGADIDDRAHRCPGAWQRADQSRSHVADALADQLPVRVVTVAGHRIGHQGGQQTVDRTQQGEDDGRLQRMEQESGRRQAELQGRQSDRDRAYDRRFREPQHAQGRSGGQRHEGARGETRELFRPEKSHCERDRTDGEDAGVDVAHGRRKRPCCGHRSPRRARSAEQRQRLHQHDDDADTGHEARYDDMRRVSHETADLRHAQKHL